MHIFNIIVELLGIYLLLCKYISYIQWNRKDKPNNWWTINQAKKIFLHTELVKSQKEVRKKTGAFFHACCQSVAPVSFSTWLRMCSGSSCSSERHNCGAGLSPGSLKHLNTRRRPLADFGHRLVSYLLHWVLFSKKGGAASPATPDLLHVVTRVGVISEEVLHEVLLNAEDQRAVLPLN